MPQLDGLRAFAVIAVIIQHYIPQEYHLGIQWGELGVQLFFVLSGFLISGILLQAKENESQGWSLFAFFARRFLRIFPLYYVVLFVAYFGKIEPVPETIWWHCFYLSNVFFFFLHQDWHGCVTHFWTLAVEEQFYLVWPWLLFLIPSSKFSKLAWVVTGIGVFSRLALELAYPDMAPHQALLISNVDALGMGALLTYAGTAVNVRIRKFLFLVLPLAIYVSIQIIAYTGNGIHPVLEWIRHECMLLIFVWTIAASSIGFKGRTGRLLTLPSLAYIGRISYGIYVIHNFALYPITVFCMNFDLNMPGWLLEFVLKIVLTFVGAAMSWHFFEAPINSLKRYFPYTKNVGPKEKSQQLRSPVSIIPSRRNVNRRSGKPNRR